MRVPLLSKTGGPGHQVKRSFYMVAIFTSESKQMEPKFHVESKNLFSDSKLELSIHASVKSQRIP